MIGTTILKNHLKKAYSNMANYVVKMLSYFVKKNRFNIDEKHIIHFMDLPLVERYALSRPKSLG